MRKNYKQKNNLNKSRKKSYFSARERQAYWVGVGISAQRHGDAEKLIESSNAKYRRSIQRGYNADNHNDVSSIFR
jgi:hypothetical protein